MRIIPILASISLAAMLAACTMPDDGYYDANGNYIGPANATTEAQRVRSPDPGRHHHPGRHDYYDNAPVVYTYDRAGYYDYNGDYIVVEDRFLAPHDMLPPRGMCRVWLPNRAPDRQPRVESCDGIQYRVPAGAYVIYGG